MSRFAGYISAISTQSKFNVEYLKYIILVFTIKVLAIVRIDLLNCRLAQMVNVSAGRYNFELQLAIGLNALVCGRGTVERRVRQS